MVPAYAGGSPSLDFGSFTQIRKDFEGLNESRFIFANS